MSNKTKSIFYGLAIVAAMINSVISFNNGDKETSLAWFCASGMAAGAFIAYSEIKKKN